MQKSTLLQRMFFFIKQLFQVLSPSFIKVIDKEAKFARQLKMFLDGSQENALLRGLRLFEFTSRMAVKAIASDIKSLGEKALNLQQTTAFNRDEKRGIYKKMLESLGNIGESAAKVSELIGTNEELLQKEIQKTEIIPECIETQRKLNEIRGGLLAQNSVETIKSKNEIEACVRKLKEAMSDWENLKNRLSLWNIGTEEVDEPLTNCKLLMKMTIATSAAAAEIFRKSSNDPLEERVKKAEKLFSTDLANSIAAVPACYKEETHKLWGNLNKVISELKVLAVEEDEWVFESKEEQVTGLENEGWVFVGSDLMGAINE